MLGAMLLVRSALATLPLLSNPGPTSPSVTLGELARRYTRDYGSAAGAHVLVPSFSRQTGLACSACHTTFPQLNAFGRAFKLNGYTLSGMQVVTAGDSGKRETLKLDLIPALSAMVQTSLTQTNKAQPGTQNGTVDFPQQLSLFFGQAITPQLGVLLQLTYDPRAGGIGMDNTDIRYADRARIGSRTLVYGASLNNNPTVQDVWNSTPAWGFPFAASGVAPTPAAATLLDGGLAQSVAGLGAYALLDNHLYGEFSVYRSAPQGTSAPADSTATNVLAGVAPYWRAFYSRQFGPQSLMLGTVGLSTSLYPQGVTGSRDRFTDIGFDAQLERAFGAGDLTVHAIWIHERQTLDAGVAAGTAANGSNALTTFRMDASVYTAARVGLTAGFFTTTGTSDTLRYAPAEVTGSGTGSPNSQGFIVELSALPWLNTRFAIQYVAYSRFNGASHNYDGFGRNANDNNTLYLLTWLTF